MREIKPYWPDHCGHLNETGTIFCGSTVNGEELQDVYIWQEGKSKRVCIRYGEDGSYHSCHGSPEEWSNGKRTVFVVLERKIVPASIFDGPAMELVRAALARACEPTRED